MIQIQQDKSSNPSRQLFCEVEMQYGHVLRDEHFNLYDGLTNLNHGSFGTVPKCVMASQVEFMFKQESCPELWFRERYQVYINKTRIDVANLIGAEMNEVVLVENASYAINGLVRSYPFKAKDVVICYSCAYAMVKEVLEFTRGFVDIEIVYIPIEYPVVSSEELVESFRLEAAKHEIITMCIFDHVSSMPSIVFPVEQLTALAKLKGAVVVIDGAHAPGMETIDVQAIGADLYTGNCHKWLFAPKGTAFLWTKLSVQTEQFPQPCVISSTGMHHYTGHFEYTGTRDYTAFATLPAALSFVDHHLGGIEAMRAHNRQLLRAGSELIVDKWKTFFVIPQCMTGFMSNVALPVQDPHKVHALQSRLMKDHHISVVYHSLPLRVGFEFPTRLNGSAEELCTQLPVPVLVPMGDHNGDTAKTAVPMVFFLRLSAQVYLDLSDFELLADTVLKLLPGL